MELHDHDDVFRTDDGAPNPKPDSFMSSSITGQPLNRWKKPYFTWAVITVNVLVFFAMMVVAKFEFVSQSFNPLIGPSIDVLDTYVVAPIADEKRWMSLQIIDRFGLDWGGAKNVNAIRGGQWWRLITSAFLHSGVVHLAINMMVLKRIGGSMEVRSAVLLNRTVDNVLNRHRMAQETFGVLRIALVYLISLIMASLASTLFLPNLLTVGASGAVYGI